VLEKEISTFVNGLLERMGFPATVTSRFEDGAYCLTVEAAGDTDGVLIGRKGETLDALQHVAYKMSGRGRDDASTVRIDIAGYLERREIELAREAVEMAKEVVATGRPRQTEPMRAAERRIVHRAIAELEGVTTRALGTGLVKRISIEVEGSVTSGADAEAPRSGAPRQHAPRGESPQREVSQWEGSPRTAGSAREVLDFVTQPAPERPAEQEKGSSSEWGRKPRPARPGRRR
jgi:spoIIIJ-associated protein